MSSAGDDLAFLTLAQAAELVRTRHVSPVELARTALQRAERLQPQLNAFIWLAEDERLVDEARRAEEEIGRGEYCGPLHGLPVTLKDLFDVTGVPTTAGAKVTSREPAASDSAVWARLRAAGAMLLGKTNLHEIALGATSGNPHFGPVRNPWAPSRIPGGSSGGSAATLAAGIGYGSIGSDTGGSIRAPAALCGVTGLKPTYDRVPRDGCFPLSWSQDHAGPMARSARDCALMLEALCGETFTAAADVGLRDIRVGVLASHAESAREEVRASFEQSLDVLRELGATLEELDLPEEAEARDAATLILLAEGAAVHLPWLRERPDDYGSDVRARLEAGALTPAVDYLDALRARRVLTARILERLSGVDVVVGPTVAVGALPVVAVQQPGEPDPRAILLRHTRIWNLTGQPALSIPCGFTPDGLPVGLQVAAHPWREALLLRVAEAYQEATDWHLRRPPDKLAGPILAPSPN